MNLIIHANSIGAEKSYFNFITIEKKSLFEELSQPVKQGFKRFMKEEYS